MHGSGLSDCPLRRRGNAYHQEGPKGDVLGPRLTLAGPFRDEVSLAVLCWILQDWDSAEAWLNWSISEAGWVRVVFTAEDETFLGSCRYVIFPFLWD